MARFAKLTCSSGASVPEGVSFDIGIFGQVVRFTSTTGVDGGDGLQWYFSQTHSGEFGYIDAAGNAANLANAIKAYLQSINEIRYEVYSSWNVDYQGFPNSFSVVIKAKEYADALNFTSAQLINGSGTLAAIRINATNANPQIATATVTDATCFGSSTGHVTLDILGGVAPFTYLWNDGATTKDRLALPAGQYSVQVTDSAQPQPLNPDLPPDSPYQTFSEDHPGIVTVSVTIGQNSQILVTGIVGEKSITLEVVGGVLPYTYSWNDGVTAKNRTDVEPGIYTCTVRDAVGCTQVVTFSISLERFFFSKNPVLLQVQAADIVNKPNLRFICEVWVEPEYLSGNFLLATPEPFEHPADSDGATQFDVSEILDAFVEPHLPDFNQATVKRADKTFKRFFLRYTEAYGDPVTVDPFTLQDNRYVLYGGLDDPEFFANTYFNSFRPNRKAFFTWDPVVKPVFTDQPEYLYFMPDSFELTDFRVKVKVKFSDGSSSTIQPFLQAGIKRFELYSIPVGHDQLGLGVLQPEKEVRSWDVYIVDSYGTVISETKRYEIDTRNYSQVRYFIYANSIGGYNTLAATGRAKLQQDAQAQLIERHRQTDAASGDATVVSKYSKRTLELSTGHKTEAEMHSLQDFLNSEDVKLVGSDRYIPGRLGDKSADISDDNPDKTIKAISFDFILPKMHRYTPTLKLEGYTDNTALLTPLAP